MLAQVNGKLQAGFGCLMVLTITGFLMLFFPSLAYAEQRGGHGQHQKRGQAEGRGQPSFRHHYGNTVPFGAHFSFVPYGALTIACDKRHYYYYNGFYYERLGQAYSVVMPPRGVLVSSTPKDYQRVKIHQR